jgi:alkylhydroperoxidase family enzyme
MLPHNNPQKSEILMVWLNSQQASASFEDVFSLRPNLYADYQQFIDVFWDQALVDPVIMELCRLRVAQLHQCQSELGRRYQQAKASGLNEDKIQRLLFWDKDDDFNERERACLHLAELFVADPHAISDEDMSNAKAFIGDNGLVALMEILAMFDGFCRFQVILGISTESTQALIMTGKLDDSIAR